jgi:hypothetical protein
MADLVPFTGLIASDNNTTYPANAILVTGASGTVNVNSNIFIDASGRVGIGTNVVDDKFEVNGNIRIESATTTDHFILGQATSVLSFIQTSGAPLAINVSTTERLRATAGGVGVNGVFSVSGATTVASLASNGTISTATADTATAASHYFVETASDSVIRPKTLANAQTEIVTTATVNAAAATTVGTITTGTWAATDVGLAHGGTAATLTAVNGGIVYSTASSMAISAAGTNGQILRSNGAAVPTWQDPTPVNGIFWENDQTVTANYTITNNKNAMSVGPITIANGITVTIGDGEVWTIV